MKELDWFAAPYAPGAIDADGLWRILGASDHDRLSLLVRETLQNSWDASRAPSGGAIDPSVTPSYDVHLRTLGSRERDALVTLFGPIETPKLPLHAELLSDDVRVLEISDRGTVGLGGPTDNTLETDPDQRTDFASLVFSVGAPITTKGGGGTFGFGKIATYAMSRARTIILHSLPTEGGPKDRVPKERLIASAIGHSFSMAGKMYTGRHWWGRMSGSIGPVQGRDAASVAKRIFSSGFSDGTTGTSILVVQPDLGDLSHDEAVQRFVASVLWNAWPKMVPWPGSDEPPMRISISSNGQNVPLPDPRSIRPFAGFAHALTEIRRHQSAGDRSATTSSGWSPPEQRPMGVLRQRVQSVDSQRPVAHVGLIAAVETMRPAMPSLLGDDVERESAGVAEHCHHLALMRGAELIVRYLPGPVHPGEADGIEWAAVFKCDPSHDELFALAEPPTHDDWHAGDFQGRDKTIVNRAAKQGPNEFFREMFINPEAANAGSGSALAAVVGEFLSGIVSVSGGLAGPRGPKTSLGPKQPVGRPKKLVNIDRAGPVMIDGRRCMMVEFSGPNDARVEVTGRVQLASGPDRDGAESVRLLGYGSVGDPAPNLSGGDEFVISGGGGRAWLEVPPDASISLDVRRCDL